MTSAEKFDNTLVSTISNGWILNMERGEEKMSSQAIE